LLPSSRAPFGTLSGLGLPKLADTTISLLSQAGVPTALFVLGLSLSRFGLKGNRAAVALLLVIKLVVMPLVAWWLATAVFDLPRVEAWYRHSVCRLAGRCQCLSLC
jgi:predicted permease